MMARVNRAVLATDNLFRLLCLNGYGKMIAVEVKVCADMVEVQEWIKYLVDRLAPSLKSVQSRLSR